ncbi:S-adenosyl-L-methionine-dependent methyltransferase [Aspergillus avenaceus]|uniref:S-adenosyl-L-methionine-dependent methyltransferase n=1 Tax=Aspergillus avenaceus TaxID=36643 RepID=A0A5N6TH71_ASPAV|nr:S-adenosyl-L-methionine-dependent methyltransferase [Aspergillus avenaceus]
MLPPLEVQHVQVDPEEIDSETGDDGYYAADSDSYATSLSSSVRDYKWCNGRRFHAYKEGSYRFPNDEQEQRRLDMMHEVFTLSLEDRLFLAPVPRNEAVRILDIGTGTGIWAMEAADSLPLASRVIGNDLSPIQPSVVPPSVVFEIDDVEAPWPPRKPFDLIHCRYMCGSVEDWPGLFRQAYQQTNIGGWIEFQDFHLETYSQDGTLDEDNGVKRFFEYLGEACDRINRPMNVGRHLKRYAEDAGFTNIQHRVIPLPLGTWPKDKRLKTIGTINMLQFLEALEACSYATFTQILGWTLDEVKDFLEKVRRDTLKKGVHILHEIHIVYAQRLE